MSYTVMYAGKKWKTSVKHVEKGTDYVLKSEDDEILIAMNHTSHNLDSNKIVVKDTDHSELFHLLKLIGLIIPTREFMEDGLQMLSVCRLVKW